MENKLQDSNDSEIKITCNKCKNIYVPLLAELKTGSCVCPSCGKETKYKSEYKTISSNKDDELLGNGAMIASFCFPLVGAIIYFIYSKDKPIKANTACKAALWGAGLTFLLSLIGKLASI